MKNLDALMAISDEYSQIGDYGKAYRYLKQAAAIDPDNIRIRKRIEEVEAIIGK
jgi:hypothetical protein